MRWEWFPETPEEKAEHQRMKRELLECQQLDKDKIVSFKSSVKKKERASCLLTIMLLVVVFAIYFLNKIDFSFTSMDNDATSHQESIQSSFSHNNIDADVKIHYGKSVSKNTSDYIQLTKDINTQLSELFKVFCVKFTNDTVLDCSDSVYKIDDLLAKINVLQNKKITAKDFNDYETSCKTYYGVYYDFLIFIKNQQTFTVEDYNWFVQNLSICSSPHEVLIKTFDENNYFYYIDLENVIHYKY